MFHTETQCFRTYLFLLFDFQPGSDQEDKEVLLNPVNQSNELKPNELRGKAFPHKVHFNEHPLL